jgi:putative ABC transport system permease protein
VKLRRLALAALRSLARNRLRSLLTALGIVIGVAAVIVMVALGQGAQRRIQREIGGLGRNMLTVFSGAGQVGGVARGAGTLATLTLDDVERLREEASLLAHVSPLVRSGVQVVAGASNWSTTIVGVSPDYLEVRDWALVEGEPFTEREERTGAKVLLLGQRVAQELFGGEPALGERVRVGRVPFRVAGVLASKGVGGGGQDLDDLVMAPVGAVLGRLTRPDAPLQIHLSVADAERMDAAAVEVQEILRASHRLREGEEDDFTIRSQADLVAAATATTETLTMLLGGVAAVSLLVGGIGIMNIMLVSVTERTKRDRHPQGGRRQEPRRARALRDRPGPALDRAGEPVRDGRRSALRSRPGASRGEPRPDRGAAPRMSGARERRSRETEECERTMWFRRPPEGRWSRTPGADRDRGEG